VKFSVMSGEPIVTVELDAKTKVERRTGMLDNEPVMIPMLRSAGYSIEPHGALSYATGLACPRCGATHNVLEDIPAMRYVTPGGDASYPSNPRYLSCTVCVGPPVRNSALFTHLHPTNRAKHLNGYSCTALHLKDYTAVSCDGKAVVTDLLSFQQTARQVAINQPDLENGFSAVLIRACAFDVAERAPQHKDFPAAAWVTVPLTSELWPKARWHNEALTMTDSEGIREYARRQRRAAAKSIEDQVAAFRADLAQRQGA
jgi:hypothetical protein